MRAERNDKTVSQNDRFYELEKRKLDLQEQELKESKQARLDGINEEKKRIKRKKHKLLIQFKKQFGILRNGVQGFSWNVSALWEFIEGLEETREKVEKLSTDLMLDYQDLAIWYWLTDYIDTLKEGLEDHESGFFSSNTITLNYSDETIEELDEILSISKFEELAPEDEDEEEDEDSEEEEDEDYEDEEDED